MKKILLLVIVIALLFAGFYLAKNHLFPIADKAGIEYHNVVKGSSSAPINSSEAIEAPASLTAMLEAGIATDQGILISERINQNGISKYQIKLNEVPLNIQAVSEIELVKGFLIGSDQVILISYNQGGNQCTKEYQFITINRTSYSISRAFGSCLPITAISETNDGLIITMPQDNPYLGPDVVVSYKYKEGKVELINKANSNELKHKYAGLTAAKILQIATQDGCYIDGVLLDDNSCGGGRKYCVMFKALSNKEKSPEYKTLKDFCN